MLLQTSSQPDILEVIADLSNDEVFTPPRVANDVLDLLPEEVWSDSTLRFLDPGSKTGVFLREVTRRLMVGLADEIPDEQERLEHILRNQVFGFAITELTAHMSRRTLYCSKHANGEHSIVTMTSPAGNVWFDRVEHAYVDGRCKECGASHGQMERSIRENYAYAFIHASGRNQVEKEHTMKFDVIVGNPPFQMESDGNNRTLPLYHKFFQQAKQLDARYVCMIMPARWMAGGLGLTDFRAEVLTDKSVRTLVDFPDASGVFPGVDIKGGVCYFLWDRDTPGDCEISTHRNGELIGPVTRQLDEFDVLVRDARALGILRKILESGDDTMTGVVSSKRPFGLQTNFRGTNHEPTSNPVRLYKSGEAAWTTRDQVSANVQWIDQWKVITPKAGPGNSGGHVIPDMVLGRPQISEPGSCCTETFIVLGPVADRAEAESLASYTLTRFFRFLVSLRKVSQDAPRGTYAWVPQQTWDRDWTDDELYTKYGISGEEQAYITEMIREMTP